MVFVTGGSGLIGSYLLLELAKRGQSIRALKRENSDLEAVKKLFLDFSDFETFRRIDWVEGDLLDVTTLSDLIQGCETIYHTAGSIDFDDRSRKTIQLVNVTGTENLVNAAISANIPNLVYVSSISVLDKLPNENFITENSKWNLEFAHSEYALSKRKAEMEVWRGSEEGLNTLVVYPSIVIGSLDGKRESEKIFRYAAKKNSVATKGETGYVDVRDVAYLLAELVDKKQWNDKFILNSEEKSYAEVFNFLRKRWNLGKVRILNKSKLKLILFFSFFSRFFGGPGLSKSSYHALTSSSTFSNQKVKDVLSFSFIPVEESLIFHSERFVKNNKTTV